MRTRKSQSLLDFILAFIALAVLSIGMVRIWIWFSANYAKRQVAYQKGRLFAGIPRADYTKPIDIGASESCPGCTHKPMDLTEKWVFEGKADETVTGNPILDITPEDVMDVCRDPCLGSKDPKEAVGCGNTKEEFNYECLCYIKCACFWNIQWLQRNLKEQVIPQIRGTAKTLRDTAKSMREAAEECDDPWEFCWWVSGLWNGNRTKHELQVAAAKLDRPESLVSLGGDAQRLDRQATDAEGYWKRILVCCGESKTVQAQEGCLVGAEARQTCRTKCLNGARDVGDPCREICDAAGEKSAASLKNAYDGCLSACGRRYDNCNADCEKQPDPPAPPKTPEEIQACKDICVKDLSVCNNGCYGATKTGTATTYNRWLACVAVCDNSEYILWGNCIAGDSKCK